MVLEQFQKKAKRLRQLRKDRRYVNVIAFLAAKGLLLSNTIEANYIRGIKIPLKDFLWVAKNIEPRVYEVLPAALIHFPSTITEKEKMKADLESVCKALLGHQSNGPGYMHASYEDIKRWADMPLTDKRVKPVSEKKVARTFRLSQRALEGLARRAHDEGVSQAVILENLLSL